MRWDRDPLEEKNWPHFERSAALMISSGCQDEEEWIRAQFATATIHDYPYPSNLYSERAVKRYLELADGATQPGAIEVQKDWLRRYQYKFPNRTIDEIVMNPLWAFHTWFRVFYATNVSIPMAAEAEKELRRSTALRESIIAAGFDLVALEEKIQGILR